MSEYPYAKGYCKTLIDFMGKGHAFENFTGEIEVPMRVIRRWLREHPDFMDAYEVGKAKHKIFWEKLDMASKVSGKRPRKSSSGD